MTNNRFAVGMVVVGAVSVSMIAITSLPGCSSETPPTPVTKDSGVADTGGGGQDSGAADTGGGGQDSGKADTGADFGSYGKTCTNPINAGGGDGGGGGGGGGDTPDGGVDPACVGVYDLCASVGSTNKCTKRCTYPGGSGAQDNPTDCPNPPTNGKCTPRGFCQ